MFNKKNSLENAFQYQSMGKRLNPIFYSHNLSALIPFAHHFSFPKLFCVQQYIFHPIYTFATKSFLWACMLVEFFLVNLHLHFVKNYFQFSFACQEWRDEMNTKKPVKTVYFFSEVNQLNRGGWKNVFELTN